MLMRSPCCLWVCESLTHQLLNAWTKLYETLYVHHRTWAHLNGILHKVCVCMCMLLGNSSVKMLPWQQICNNRRTVFYAVHVISKKSLCLYIPLLLLGKSSENIFPQQQGIVWGTVFYVVHVILKENRWLVLSRISCCNISYFLWI
jgi:hypothetical protein